MAAVKLGKSTRPDIHLGVCGENGGDPTINRILSQCWT